jgi:hypothetical protein
MPRHEGVIKKCETRNEAALQSLKASFALLAFTVPVIFRYLVSFLAVTCSDVGAAAGSLALGSFLRSIKTTTKC